MLPDWVKLSCQMSVWCHEHRALLPRAADARSYKQTARRPCLHLKEKLKREIKKNNNNLNSDNDNLAWLWISWATWCPLLLIFLLCLAHLMKPWYKSVAFLILNTSLTWAVSIYLPHPLYAILCSLISGVVERKSQPMCLTCNVRH